MNILETHDLDEAQSFADECLAGREGAIIFVCDEAQVLTGQTNTMNKAKCEELGLSVTTALHIGGTLVCMPGDVVVCLTTWGRTDYAKKLTETFADWLAGYGLVGEDNNDVTMYGKKVVSWAGGSTAEGWYQSGVHFSIGPMNLDLVDAICTKPRKKTPGSLMEYHIGTEDVLEVIKENMGLWLK